MRRMFSMKRPEQFKVSRHEPWNFFFFFTRLLFCWEEKNRKTAGTCPIHSRRRSPTFQKFPSRKTTWRIIIMSPDDLLLLTWPQTGISGLVGQYHITQLFTKAECVSWECSYYRVTHKFTFIEMSSCLFCATFFAGVVIILSRVSGGPAISLKEWSDHKRRARKEGTKRWRGTWILARRSYVRHRFVMLSSSCCAVALVGLIMKETCSSSSSRKKRRWSRGWKGW